MTAPAVRVEPLTPARWADLEALFGPKRGAYGGCWCMWWRLSSKDFGQSTREARKSAFREMVEANAPLGVLAYAGDDCAGWCAVAPRSDLPKLNRSRVAKSDQDDLAGIWMINCFFIDRPYRKSGLMVPLIEGAVNYARENGARSVEACPIEPNRTLQWSEGYVGIHSAFQNAGFEEVARRSPTRPLMRRSVGG